MSVIVIAQLSFTDVERYRAYQARFFDVFSKFKGRLLAADEAPKLLEGDWFGDKVVLMAFPDESEADRFMSSPEYQKISVDRDAGASTVALMIKALE